MAEYFSMILERVPRSQPAMASSGQTEHGNGARRVYATGTSLPLSNVRPTIGKQTCRGHCDEAVFAKAWISIKWMDGCLNNFSNAPDLGFYRSRPQPKNADTRPACQTYCRIFPQGGE